MLSCGNPSEQVALSSMNIYPIIVERGATGFSRPKVTRSGHHDGDPLPPVTSAPIFLDDANARTKGVDLWACFSLAHGQSSRPSFFSNAAPCLSVSKVLAEGWVYSSAHHCRVLSLLFSKFAGGVLPTCHVKSTVSWVLGSSVRPPITIFIVSHLFNPPP